MGPEVIDGVKKKPMRREYATVADKQAIYRMVACQGIGIFTVARRRGLSVAEVVDALVDVAKVRELEAERRGRLSVSPPRWPSPAKAA